MVNDKDKGAALMDESEIRQILNARRRPFAVETYGGEVFQEVRTTACEDHRFKFNDLKRSVALDGPASTRSASPTSRPKPFQSWRPSPARSGGGHQNVSKAKSEIGYAS